MLLSVHRSWALNCSGEIRTEEVAGGIGYLLPPTTAWARGSYGWEARGRCERSTLCAPTGILEKTPPPGEEGMRDERPRFTWLRYITNDVTSFDMALLEASDAAKNRSFRGCWLRI